MATPSFVARMLPSRLLGSRRIDPPAALTSAIAYAIGRTYGPGYSFEVRAGVIDEPAGTSKASKSGRHIVDSPGAADVRIIAPDGHQLRGAELTPLGQNWVANFGSIGINATAGEETGAQWTHLDFTRRAGAGTRVWSYGGFAKGQQKAIQSAINAGKWLDGKPADEVSLMLEASAESLRQTTIRKADPTKLANLWGREPFDKKAVADANNPEGLTPPADIPNAGKPVKLSDADRDAAIRTVIGESIGEGDEGQTAVAHVIRNRFATGGGKSVASIATDASQFDAWNHDLVTAYGPGDPVYEKAAAIVDGVFSGETPDPTGGATFFYSGKKQPGFWSKGVTEVKTIGNHVFGVAKDAVRAVLPKPPAVAASDRYSEDQQVKRPDVIAGKLQVTAPTAEDDEAGDRSPLDAYLAGGPGFDFQTGGKAKTFGSMPFGEYPISPLTTAAERKAAGRSWQQDAFPLPDMVDPKMATFADRDLKRTARAQGGRRTGMLIHSGDDIDKLLNAGCLAIPQEQWPAFKRTLLAQQDIYGDLVLELSPEGAVIHPKSDKPADLKIVPAKEFVAENRAVAAPVIADAEAAVLREEEGGQAKPETAALQAALKARGLYDGAIDGKFGPRTKAALVAHQESAGLKPDGVAGPLSLTSLGLPTKRAELAKAVPNPELPANRRLADQAAADLIAEAAASVPAPRPRPERGLGVPEPRPNPRRPELPARVVEGVDRLPAVRPEMETVRAAPGAGGRPAAPAQGRPEDSADRIIAVAGIPPDGPTARAIKAQLRAPDATQVFGPGQTGERVRTVDASSTPPEAIEDGPPALVAADPDLQRRLDAARLALAAGEDKRSRAPTVPERPLPDPRDMVANQMPGAGRSGVKTGLVAAPRRTPNVAAASDIAAGQRPSFLDEAMVAVLPEENFLYDFVYDPTKPSRLAEADVEGPPPKPAPAAVASGAKPAVDPLNLFGHLNKTKDQSRAPGMETASDAATALAAADTRTKPLTRSLTPTVPDTLSRYVAEPAALPDNGATGRVLSAGAMIGGPDYDVAEPPYRGLGVLTGLTRADTAIDPAAEPAVAAPPIEPEDSPRGRSPLAAVARPLLERAGQAIENRFAKIINPFGEIFGGPGSGIPAGSPTPASRLFGQTPFVPHSTGTTPVGGMSYTLGTVGNRNAIQGNGWTAVEQSDGSYSMSYG